jgi:hypothetical protein
MSHVTSFITLANDRLGFGLQRQLHWIVGFIGYGFISFGSASVPSIVMTYGTFPLALLLMSSCRLLLPRCI